MKYLDKIFMEKRSECIIVISEDNADYNILRIQIEINKYNKNRSIIKSFEDCIELKFSDILKLRKIYNVCNDIDVILMNIFNRIIEKDDGKYKYHLTKYDLYVRKGLTKFIVLPNDACINLVKNAITDYYEKRKSSFGIKDCPPKVL